jgi:hypothetical protein
MSLPLPYTPANQQWKIDFCNTISFFHDQLESFIRNYFPHDQLKFPEGSTVLHMFAPVVCEGFIGGAGPAHRGFRHRGQGGAFVGALLSLQLSKDHHSNDRVCNAKIWTMWDNNG